MKQIFIVSKNLMTLILTIIFSLSFFINTRVEAQDILSNAQLLQEGVKAYDNNDYKKAAIMLFAYIQKNPSELQKCADAYKYSFERVMNGVGVKSDGCPCVTPNNNGKPGLNASAPSTIIPGTNASIISGKAWTCNDGGTYYITVNGNEVWWYGRGSDGGFTNVMHGTISGRVINGSWADVPQGNTRSTGKIDLYIDDLHNFHVIEVTGGFGGSKWYTSKIPISGVTDKLIRQ